MISSQLVLLLAGAVASVNAQSKAQASVTLWQFDALALDDKATATAIATNSGATTYTFACPAVATGSMASRASSAGSAAGSLASSIGGAAGSIASSAASAGASAGSSIGNAIASDVRSRVSNAPLTPIAKPTNAARDVRLKPIPNPTKAARDLRLLPISKPTGVARRDLPFGTDIPCLPYTVVSGSETYAIKAEVTAPIKVSGEFNAKWKGDIKSAGSITASFTFGGDVTELNRGGSTVAPASVLTASSVVVAVATGSASGSPSGTAGSPAGGASGSPSSTPARNSNPAAAGPLPTGAAAYLGAAVGIFGAALAL